MDDVAVGIAAAGCFAFTVSIAAPAGNIAAPIAPVALINALRDTSVMIGFPYVLLILAYSCLPTGHRRLDVYEKVNTAAPLRPSEFK